MTTLASARSNTTAVVGRIAGALGAMVAAGLCLSGAARAADGGTESWLDPVIVTGTRLADAQAHEPAATTVIDAQSIALRNPDNLPDLLRTLPGVQLTQPGGGAGIVSFFVRGCQPNYTLFLVDGVKVTDSNDSRGGSFDLSTVSPGEIERVEVIRGPQSAVYGADALCGVVNVITKSHSSVWGTTLTADAGRASSYLSTAELSGPLLEAGGLSLRASTADQGNLVQGASFGTSSVNGKLTLDRDTGWSFTLHARHAEDHGSSYPDLSGGPEFALMSARDVRSSKETGVDAQGHSSIGEAWTVNAMVAGYRHEVDFASPGVLGPYNPIPPRGETSDLQRQYAALNAVVKLPADLRATFGADYTHEYADLAGQIEFAPGFSLADSYVQSRDNVGVFGEMQYAGVHGLTLLGSARRDDPRTITPQTTTRAGVVYTPDDGLTSLRASWGQGFKLPSLWALGNALVGNPNLLPEKSRTTEIGLERLLFDRRLKAGVTLFDNVFTNLIDYDGNSFSFVNRREVKGRGGELELGYQLASAWRVRAEVTYVQIDPEDSGIPLRERPKWRGSLDAQWSPSATWSLYATWLSVGPAFDQSVATGDVYVGGYSQLDVNANWQASGHLTMTLAVDNVLNKRYAETVGFTAPGIAPRLGVRYRF